MVDFLVDTGSSSSAITEKEAILMGLDCSSLPESKRDSIGFGGTFKPKIINRLVTLTFKSSEKQEYKINFSSGFMVTCTPPNIKQEEREILIRCTPSVLGMNILTKFETYVNKRRVKLTLSH